MTGGGIERWADWRTTMVTTGIRRDALAQAVSAGEVRFDLRRPGHVDIPMLCVDDVLALQRRDVKSRLRVIDGGRQRVT